MRVANAPCSWGALEFDWAGPAPSFARVLDEMRATDYDGTELGDWGFLPIEPAPLRSELAARKLERVLTTDPAMGVLRHADAGYERALAVARERGVHVPMVEERP